MTRRPPLNGAVKPAVATGAVTLVLVLASLGATEEASDAQPRSAIATARNGKIAFDRVRPSNPEYRDVWVVAADGTGLQRLTTRSYNEGPLWSPDGTKLAFRRLFREGQLALPYIVNSAGGAGRVVRAGPFTSGLSWSPDGRRIAFARRMRSGTSTQTDIYVADLRRGSIRRLTSSPADDDDPLWSPRGDRIAFIRERPFRRGTARALYAISARAGRSERLTREFFWLEGKLQGPLEAAWSPDGEQLVLAAERATMPGLYVVGNGRIARLSRSPSDHDPEWSPDGRAIVFSGKHPSRHVGLHISLINPDGTGRRVISANSGSEATWSPDGKKIVFTGFNGNGTLDIYVVRRDGTELRRLTRLANVGFPSWQPLPG